MSLRIMLVSLGLRIISLCLFVLVGLLFAALGRPLMRRQIGPNGFYGYRVPKTLNDPKVWYDANEYCGRCCFWYGITIALSGTVLFFIPVIDWLAYTITMLVVVVAGLVVSLVLSDRYLGKITKPKRVHAGDDWLE